EEILVDFPLPTNLSSAFFALQPLQHCFKLKFRAECPSFLPCHFQLSPSSPQFYDFLSLLSRNWVALQTPLIFLSKVGNAAERAMAIEEGADDFINRPYDALELVARIRAVLRRAFPTMVVT